MCNENPHANFPAVHFIVMILGRVERYTIQQEPAGLVITMRQWKGALGCTVFALGMLALMIWKAQPPLLPGRRDTLFWVYGLFCAVAGMFALLGLAGAFYEERWIISDTEIVAANSFSKQQRRIPRGPTLKLRVQIMPGSGRNRSPLPCRVHLVDTTGQENGLQFEFRASQHMDQFLFLLRTVLSLDIEDFRVVHGSV